MRKLAITEPSRSKSRYGFIVITEENRKHKIMHHEIIRLEAEGSYTNVFTKTRPVICCTKRIGLIEEELNSELFCRIHRSTAINLLEVKEYQRGRGGNVWLTDNTKLQIAYRYKTEFVERLFLMASVYGKRVYEIK